MEAYNLEPPCGAAVSTKEPVLPASHFVETQQSSFYFSEAKQLKILCMSDIHASLRDVNKASEFLVNRGDQIDIVIVSGDLANMKGDDFTLPERFSAAEGTMSGVISCIENIQCRVIYIPGNHDPKSTASVNEPTPRLTPHSCNVHNRCIRLAPDLVCVGFGGSMPATRDGEVVWNGYPWEDDSVIATHVSKLLTAVPPASPAQPVCEPGLLPPPPPPPPDSVQENDTVILLTHVGPLGTDTTEDKRALGKSPILAGSGRLRAIVEEESSQQRVIAHVHGHVHNSAGRSSVGCVSVLNPGALCEGNFMLLRIARSSVSMRWQVLGTEFVHIPRTQ